MSTFIQLHLLTSYPPSNLNRDELGRPKTAIMGGEQRLRISSQCLKRAWRTSNVFEESLAGHIGKRTKEMGEKILQAFLHGSSLRDILDNNPKNNKNKIDEKTAKKWAHKIISAFIEKIGNKEKKDEKAEENTEGEKKQKEGNISLKTEQIVFYNNQEIENIDKLIDKLRIGNNEPSNDELKSLLTKISSTVDVGMFGRMLANAPDKNTEAAVQVAHAITVHKAAVEDDFFTAVDDLNMGEEHAGSAHLGEAEFGAGLYYVYVCINKDLLKDNLQGDEELVKKAIRALTESAVTISPSGKQNSFASRAFASYALAEKGKCQPRSLSAAFLKPVTGKDIEQESVIVLTKIRDNFNSVYDCKNESYEMHASQGEGKLEELLNFAAN